MDGWNEDEMKGILRDDWRMEWDGGSGSFMIQPFIYDSDDILWKGERSHLR